MTVSNTDSPVKIYTGTATEYPIPFDYISDNDILVTLYNTETGVSTDQTKDVHYTISNETVIYSEAPGSVYNVVIRRVTPYTQEASFGPGEEPPLSTYESCFDKLTMLAQDLNERLSRCVILPDSYSGEDFTLPDLTTNAGRLLRINEDGTGLDVLAVGESGQVTEVTEYCDTADLEKLHEIISYGALEDWVDVRGYNNSISAALDAIGDVGAILYVAGDVSLDTDTTIPENIGLIIRYPGTITLGDHNLTINGLFQGSPECFLVSGAGSLVFGSATKVHVSWFGSDATAFQDAINAAAGGKVLVDVDLSLASTVTVSLDNTEIYTGWGRTITYTGSGTAIKIKGQRIRWFGPHIQKSAVAWADGSDTTSIGMDLSDSKYCTVDAFITGFNVGLWVNGETAGCVHNFIRIVRIYNNRIGVYVFSASGWANSNYLTGGHITVATGLCDIAQLNAVSVIDIFIAGTTEGSYANNHNVFDGVSLEGGFNTAIPDNTFKLLYCNGIQNDFINCRWECAYNGDAAWTPIHFGADSLYNRILGGRPLTTLTTAGIKLDNKGNAVQGNYYIDYGRPSLLKAGIGAFSGGGSYPEWSLYDNAAVFAQNLGSAAYYNFLGKDLAGEKTFSVTGQGKGYFAGEVLADKFIKGAENSSGAVSGSPYTFNSAIFGATTDSSPIFGWLTVYAYRSANSLDLLVNTYRVTAKGSSWNFDLVSSWLNSGATVAITAIDFSIDASNNRLLTVTATTSVDYPVIHASWTKA